MGKERIDPEGSAWKETSFPELNLKMLRYKKKRAPLRMEGAMKVY
jgi:hypothetical protein